jgi:hypothetical protein
MFKSKKFNYLILSFIIFSLPILEFLKDNFHEIGIILGKSFFILIFLIFIFLLIITFLLKFFLKKKDFYDSFLISVVGFWLLFKHNSINQILITKIENNSFIEIFSSETSLIIIFLFFIIFLIFFLQNNIFLKKFFFIFFYLNFILIIVQLSLSKSNLTNKEPQLNSEILFPDLVNDKKQNIYFFILDAMQPIKDFEEYYKIDLTDFLNQQKSRNYVYVDNTLNLYGNTLQGLSAFFNLDKIISEDDKLKIKSSSYFPVTLKENKSSNLLNNLNNLGYDFKWAGNYYAYCPKFNLKYCLNPNNNTFDLYLNLSFVAKSPFIQLIQKFGELFNFDFRDHIFSKSLGGGGLFKLHDGMGRLTNYLSQSKKIVKPTFYFIHHMSPHHPYLTASDCSYKNYPGKENYEGYKAAYLCNLKRISETINFLEKKDPDSFVIFQSDHSWEMAKTPMQKRRIFNLFKMKDECQYNLDQNLNNVNMLRLILSCITGNEPKFIID